MQSVSIINDWAACLGLRHQGVLVSAIRGCDSAEREDASKYLVRAYRGVLLRPHCGDIIKASSFMMPFVAVDFETARLEFLRSIDHYPNHWLLHFTHACEIVGYKHPEFRVAYPFGVLYSKLVRKFHMHPETCEQMDARLGADEDSFKMAQ
jgi:hypothetical protein